MTKTKLERLVSELVSKYGDRVVIDYCDRDDNVSVRKVTFKEYVVEYEPSCRGDLELLEKLIKQTEKEPIVHQGYYLHNEPEDIARRKKEHDDDVRFLTRMASTYLGPYMELGRKYRLF